MNAPTERLPLYADAMTWFADDDTTTDTATDATADIATVIDDGTVS